MKRDLDRALGTKKKGRFRVTRTWEVEAYDLDDAVDRTRDWSHNEIHVRRIPIPIPPKISTSKSKGKPCP